jgi:hypothetical protein
MVPWVDENGNPVVDDDDDAWEACWFMYQRLRRYTLIGCRATKAKENKPCSKR